MNSAHKFLCRINTFLDNVDVGEYYVHGDLEAYSCMVMSRPVHQAAVRQVGDMI